MAGRSDYSSLPDEIITNILMRLPVKSIVRMRCVCKQWKNLFKTPSFITEHLSHSDRKNPFLLLHEFNYEHWSSSLRLLNHKLETAEVVPIPSIDSFRKHRLNILGSCNGLLCVQVDEYAKKNRCSLFLWNPAIREVRELPRVYDDHRRFRSVGFGFSSVINDYKIVIFSRQMFTKDGEIGCRIEVYSLRTDSWKELEIGPLLGTMGDDLVVAVSQSQAASVDRTIFWLVPNKVVSFDIATEVFTVTSMQTEDGIYRIGRGVYDSKLACLYGVVEESGHFSVRVCVMEEVASESGKIFKITQTYRTKQMPDFPVLNTLYIWRNEIVCLNKKKTEVEGDPKCFLCLFDLITNVERKCNCSKASDWCYVVNYEKSLVSVSSPLVEYSDS